MSEGGVGASSPVASGRPMLCGAFWGAGFSLLICSFLLLQSDNAYGHLAIFFATPFAFLAGSGAGMALYSLAAHRFQWPASAKFQIAAAMGAVVLAAIPWAGETMMLYSIAYFDMPTYPGSGRLETNVLLTPRRITARWHTIAQKPEVLKYYDVELRRRNWATHLDPSFSVSATKSGYILFVYVDERAGEIRLEWYSYYATH